METIEKLPLREVLFLASIKYSDFKQEIINDTIIEKKMKPKESDIKCWFNNLQHFCKSIIKTKGIIKRIYSYSQNTPAGLGGRLFCGGSVQGLWGKYRGLIMRDISTDIDMANAHPTILRWVCKQHNIKCPELEYYINNRDECLSKFQSRNIGKTAYLVATNMDKINRNTNTPQCLKDYDKEMKKIQKELINKPEYQALYDTIPLEKRESNYNGCAVNRILCYYENIILQHCIDLLNKKGLEIAVLMMDGCIIYGNHYENPELLNNITAYVGEKMPDLNMKWAYKEHDMTLSVPDDFDETEKQTEETEGVWSDTEASEKLFKLYPHWVCCNNILYVFDAETGIWNNDTTSYYRIIKKYSNYLHLLITKQTKNGEETIKSTKSYGNDLILMKKIPDLIKTLCVNNDWESKCENSSLGKLLFTNGYIDLHTQQFHDKFNPDIVFFGRIPYEFDGFDDDEMKYMEDIKKRLFTDPLGEEMGDYFLLKIARAIAGDMQKNYLFALGPTGTGKTTISNALTSAFGDYIGCFNAENLLVKKDTDDEAKAFRWALLLRYKRIILSNEMKPNSKLSASILQKISSGGDGLTGRVHGGLETTFKPHFMAICFANDMNRVEGRTDAIDVREIILNYIKQFVDTITNEFELKKNYNLNNEIATQRFKRVFCGLVINRYFKFLDDGGATNEIKPNSVIESAIQWGEAEEDSSYIKKFLGDYEITESTNDFIRNEEVKEWIEKKRIGISQNKFSGDLKKYCIINKYAGVENKPKSFGKKTIRGWFGIKKIIETPEIETEIITKIL